MKSSSPLLRSNIRLNMQDSLSISRDLLIMQRQSRTVDSNLSFYSIQKALEDAPEDKPQDIQQLNNWYHKMTSLQSGYPMPETASSIGFLLKVQQLSGIAHRRKQKSSKLFIKVYSNIFNKESKSFCGQTYQSSGLPLEQVRQDLFQLNDPVALYFFSCEQYSDKVAARVDFCIFEFQHQKMLSYSFIGGFSVNPFNHPRGRVRETLRHKTSDDTISSAVLSYSCANSESIKLLLKLIPIHCVCGVEDNIPGLLAGRLPHGSGYMRIELTASYSLRFQLLFLEIPESVSFQVMKLMKNYLQSRAAQSVKEIKIESVFLRICYHNGWRAVSTCDLDLDSKKSIDIVSRNMTYKATQYQTKKLGILPTVFVQPNTVLFIQLIYRLSSLSSQSPESFQYAVAGYSYILQAKDVVRKYRSQLICGPKKSLTNQLPILSTAGSMKIEFDIQMQPSGEDQAIAASAEFTNFDRLEMEKSRMVQEKRKIKQERRKLQMEYSDLPKVMDVADVVEQTYLEKLMVIRKERDANLEKLNNLKSMLERYEVPVPEEKSGWEDDIDDMPRMKGTAALYYKTLLEPTQQSKVQSNLPTVLIDEIPSAPIIRTQLLESSYSSWFTFSFLTLQTQSHRLPRKFTISMSFMGMASQPPSQPKDPYMPTLRTRPLLASLSTGQLSHFQASQGDPNDQHPIYTVRYQPNQYRPRQQLLNLLFCMLTNKLQLTLHDEYGIEFGSVLLPLSGLLRRRRQEVKLQHELQLFLKDTVKGVLKLQVVNSRQQPSKVAKYEERVRSPDKDRLLVVSKGAKENQEQDTSPTKLELVGEDRIKQRIEKLKSRQKYPPQSQKSQLTPATTTSKLRLVDRVFQAKTATQKVICVTYMIPEIFFLQFNSPQTSNPQLYSISIIDPDDQYCSELQLVSNAAEAKRYLQEKFMENYQVATIKNVDDMTITLAKKEKLTMVFKYVTERSAIRSVTPGKANRERVVCIYVSSNDSVLSLYRIIIKPLPDIYHIQQTFYGGQGQNTTLALPPFCSPQTSRPLHVQFSIPNLVLHWIQNNQLTVTVMTPQLSDLITTVQFNMIVFEDEIQPNRSKSPTPSHTPEPTPRTQRELQQNYSSSRVVSIWHIKVVSCEKVLVCGKLGVETETLVRLGRNIPSVPLIAVSEDQKVIRTTAPSKFPDGSCSFRIKVTPNFIGQKSFYLRVLDAKSYETVHQYVVEVNSEQPVYKATFKVQHKKSLQRRQQEFEYTNPLPKKTQFLLSSTNPYLLRPETPSLEIAASKPKQFKLTLFSPTNSIEYAEITLSFTDRQQTVREFFLFKITYI